jgi:non-ribosomal peptide synthetase component F
LHVSCHIYNFYGPAECTEAAIEHYVTENDLDSQAVPIGKPMANVHVYLLDEYLQPVIPGMQMGEIFLGGRSFLSTLRIANVRYATEETDICIFFTQAQAYSLAILVVMI